jgi:hypothetical protein
LHVVLNEDLHRGTANCAATVDGTSNPARR